MNDHEFIVSMQAQINAQLAGNVPTPAPAPIPVPTPVPIPPAPPAGYYTLRDMDWPAGEGSGGRPVLYSDIGQTVAYRIAASVLFASGTYNKITLYELNAPVEIEVSSQPGITGVGVRKQTLQGDRYPSMTVFPPTQQGDQYIPYRLGTPDSGGFYYINIRENHSPGEVQPCQYFLFQTPQ